MSMWPHSVRRRFDGLHRVSDRLQRLGEREDVVQGVIDAVEEHLGFEYGAVLLLDADTGRLVPRAVSRQGRDDAFVEADKRFIASRVPGLEQGIAAWVARTGATVRSGDVRGDPRYLGLREGIRSELCVPLLARGRVVGVLNTETTRRNAYRQGDEKALEIVAGALALAIVAERSAGGAGQRGPAARPLAMGPSGEFFTRCSWCRRIRGPDLSWRHLAPGESVDSARPVTHGICPDCLERFFPI